MVRIIRVSNGYVTIVASHAYGITMFFSDWCARYNTYKLKHDSCWGRFVCGYHCLIGAVIRKRPPGILLYSYVFVLVGFHGNNAVSL